jgi:hypothetical protein
MTTLPQIETTTTAEAETEEPDVEPVPADRLQARSEQVAVANWLREVARP